LPLIVPPVKTSFSTTIAMAPSDRATRLLIGGTVPLP
jgi:hypothetical protein